MAWLVTALLLLSVGQSLGDGMKHAHPHTPADWICLTTAGGYSDTGGKVNLTWCGDVCSKHEESTVWIGYMGAFIAILLFGSNLIPVKQFDTGDGMFFQWILCIGIWLVGLVVNMALNQPPFFLPALLGGVLWTTGDLMVIPIIKMIGLTVGLTVWGTTNMLAGWFSGVFLLQEKVNCPALNYAGVVVVVVSVVILAFVKSEGKTVKKHTHHNGGLTEDETTALLRENTDALEGSLREDEAINNSAREGNDSSSPIPEEDLDASWVDRLGTWNRRILGFSLSLLSGLFYGFQFLPVQYMKLCDDVDHSCNDLDYTFGHFTGILLASTVYFMIYCAARLNKPKVYPKVIFPALISGIMWGVAMLGWFVANQHLSLGVSFPIITAGPGFVSSAWGIFVFREIKGWRYRIIYFSAFSVSVCGLVMDGLSQCTVTCH